MSKLEWVPWPIDNKHVLEDFTDVFHGGDCVERRHNGIVRQAFYDGAALWEVCYRFGDNKFELYYRGGSYTQEMYWERMYERIMSLCDEDNQLRVIAHEGATLYACRFEKAVEYGSKGEATCLL